MISVWTRLIDLVSPRRCVVCGGRLVGGEDVVCSRCNLDLPRTGYHFDPYENDMAKMFWGRMKIERCATLMFYDAGSTATNVVRRMKYNNHPEIGVRMGAMMAAEMQASGFFDGIDLLMAVPLAANRLRQRGFNQSAELALGVSRETGIRVASGVVRRTEYKESQTMKHRWERNENVEGSFKLVDGAKVSGKHVLLIDDVATTGATLIACGSELLKAGGVSLSILTLAYTHYVG